MVNTSQGTSMRHLCLAALFALSPALARAECAPLRDFIKQETQGDDKYVDTFSFRRDHRADSVLMLVKHTIERGHLPDRWLFLHRDDPASAAYCVVSRGVTFGQHEDMPENASANTFGPPASGLPRCAASNADFTAVGTVAAVGQPRTRREQHPLRRRARRPRLPVRHRAEPGLDHHRGRRRQILPLRPRRRHHAALQHHADQSLKQRVRP